MRAESLVGLLLVALLAAAATAAPFADTGNSTTATVAPPASSNSTTSTAKASTTAPANTTAAPTSTTPKSTSHTTTTTTTTTTNATTTATTTTTTTTTTNATTTATNTTAAPPTTTATATTATTTTATTTTTTTKGSNTTAAPPTTTAPAREKIESAVLAKGWIPFTVIVVLCILYSWMFVGYYQHQREKEFGSTAVTILAIAAALLCSTLVPVDVYLTSQYKKSDGTWQQWALDNEGFLTDTVTYAYYAAYGLIMAFVFCFVPLAYFFFEEKDEVENVGCGKRFRKSLMYTLGLLLVMGVVILIGALAVSSGGDTCNENVNATNWKSWSECRATYAEQALTSSSGANAISFTVGLLTVVGVLYFIFYTAVGMVAMPLNMIRSRLSSTNDRTDVAGRIQLNEEKSQNIRSQYSGRKKNRMSRRERRLLEEMDHENDVLQRASRRADRIQKGCLAKIGAVLRPFEFIFGIVFLLISIFIVTSLTMTAGDKLLQITQQHLNWKTGYTQAAPRIPNPVDLLLRALQTVFPLDYIVLVLMVYYFLAATMSGVRSMGVRFCGFKIFNISRGRTVPQALLFLSTIITFTLLFVNIVLLTLAPQYITYGNQKFPSVTAYDAKTNPNVTATPLGDVKTALCDTEAPQFVYYVQDSTADIRYVMNLGVYEEQQENHCIQTTLTTVSGTMFDLTNTTRYACDRTEACKSTRVAALLHAFFYNMWFLGLIYYWANWGFVLVFVLALAYLGCKRRKSLVASLVNDARHDFHDSDDDMKPFSPDWL